MIDSRPLAPKFAPCSRVLAHSSGWLRRPLPTVVSSTPQAPSATAYEALKWGLWHPDPVYRGRGRTSPAPTHGFRGLWRTGAVTSTQARHDYPAMWGRTCSRPVAVAAEYRRAVSLRRRFAGSLTADEQV